MLELEEQINKEIVASLRSKDQIKLSTFRMLKAAIINERINQGKNFKEEDLVKTLRRELKKRQEAATAFQQGGNQVLAQKELQEAALITALLPGELAEEKIIEIIKQTLTEGNFLGLENFGLAMKAVMAKVAGQANGNVVSRLLKEKLTKSD